MKLRVHVTIEYDDGSAETTAEEVAVFQRDATAESVLGLTLAESKSVLSSLQQTMLTHQAKAWAAQFATYVDCGTARRRNGRDTVTYRTLFGNFELLSQRYCHCNCSEHETKTFSSLATLLPERTAPEFAYLQSKWASLISYGQTVKLLEEVLPLKASAA